LNVKAVKQAIRQMYSVLPRPQLMNPVR